MEDIIAIESRLTDVRYQLESLEAQLRTIDNQVDYSTVYLRINEVQRYTPPVEKGTWERIRIGFSENVYRVGDGLKEFFIGFAISLPVLFIWVIIIALVAFIVRLIVRAAEKGNEKRRKDRGTQTTAHPMYGAAGRNVPPVMYPGSGMYGPAGGNVPSPGFVMNHAPSEMPAASDAGAQAPPKTHGSSQEPAMDGVMEAPNVSGADESLVQTEDEKKETGGM